MKHVTIYTTPSCVYCKKAKDFMNENRIPFTEINVQESESQRRHMINTSGSMSVPQFEIGDDWIVGFNPTLLRDKVQ